MAKKIIYVLVIIVVIVASILGIKYTYYSLLSPFEFVKRKGAIKTTIPTAGDRYEYGNYGFYSNNRAIEFSTKRKGSYDKDLIRWDDGAFTKMSNIFK